MTGESKEGPLNEFWNHVFCLYCNFPWMGDQLIWRFILLYYKWINTHAWNKFLNRYPCFRAASYLINFISSLFKRLVINLLSAIKLYKFYFCLPLAARTLFSGSAIHASWYIVMFAYYCEKLYKHFLMNMFNYRLFYVCLIRFKCLPSLNKWLKIFWLDLKFS
jgi:hypothetical protein